MDWTVRCKTVIFIVGWWNMLRTLTCRLVAAPILASLVVWILAAEAAEKTPNNSRSPQVEPTDGEVDFFEQTIRPILAERCYGCHSNRAKEVRGGLMLDSRQDLRRGGDSGTVIVPGDVAASRMIEAIRYSNADLQMPPSGMLSEREIAAITRWVAIGAPDPREEAKTVAAAFSGMSIEEGRRFWSFQPVKPLRLPSVSQSRWARRSLDFFVLAELDARGLTPSPPADKRTLIRRATLDLTGLPPTTDDVRVFEDDLSPDAYVRLIDRLLSSPHYGERWARVWLDKARYTDRIQKFENSKAKAWLYRDWIIRALNDDVSYDEFVKRQLATDLIPETGPTDIPALGFLGLSPTYWKELKLDQSLIKGTVAKEWEERIDTIGRTFLGLTLACARCHDHKFDPIKTDDYYGIAGVIASSRLIDRPLLSDEEWAPIRRSKAQIEVLLYEKGRLSDKKGKTETDKKHIERIGEQVKEIEESLSEVVMARAVDEASLYVLPDGSDRTRLEYRVDQPRDLHVQIRGDATKLGSLVRRRFISVLTTDPPRKFRRGSGRLDLAEAICGDAAPLATRVLVNRIWEQHFGRGLVDTPSNFGVNGARPSHPYLLEDLVARFIQNGWSYKWLHREIMLSATYMQSSDPDERNHAIDAENRWLWRMNRRRLDIETWRDSMLDVAGVLSHNIGGPPIDLQDDKNVRRTIYGLVDRRELNTMLRLHDFPDPASHSPHRERTTTATQQLFALNSSLISQQARSLYDRLQSLSLDSLESQVQQLYRWLFARSASPRQVLWARQFFAANDTDKTEAWHQYVHALLASNEFEFID